MVQRVRGVSAEKALQLIERWPTPASLWRGMGEERRGSRSAEVDRKAGGAWVERELGTKATTRGIKGVLAGRIWSMFNDREVYTE